MFGARKTSEGCQGIEIAIMNSALRNRFLPALTHRGIILQQPDIKIIEQ